jgi:hypothetical protein
MLRSIGTKGGTILYHIGYGTTLGCPTIIGLIGCYQLKCWLFDVGLVTKPSCGQFVAQVHQHVSLECSIQYVVEKLWVILSSIILIYHPQKDNFWIHVQHVDNMHMYVEVVSTVGSGFVIGIFHWIGGCSMVFIIDTLDQILWISGCVYWITTGVVTTSTSFACGWKPN